MHPIVRFQLGVRRLLHNRELLAPRFYLRRMQKQRFLRELTSFVQTKIPYSLPLPALPYVVNIEPTTFCNLRCIMCPSPTLASPRGYMSMAVYEKVLRESVAGGVHRMRFVGLGEPLLHADLPEMIRMAKRGGLYTEVSTNATLLTPELGRALLDAGLDEIGFSLDSADEAEFERIRKGAHFHDVMAKIDGFLALCAENPGRAPITVARMVVMNQSGVEAFSKRWSGKVDSLQFNLVRVYAGTPVDKAKNGALPRAHVERRVRCRQIMHHLMVGWDGQVGLCNQSSVIVGNVKTASLATIWRSHAFEEVRRVHACYEGRRIDVCKSCPVMEPDLSPEEREPATGLVTLRRPWRDEQIAPARVGISSNSI